MIVLSDPRPSLLPGFLPDRIGFTVLDPPQIIAECPSPYHAAMEDIKIREKLLGMQWFQHNAELAHQFYEMKKSWWQF